MALEDLIFSDVYTVTAQCISSSASVYEISRNELFQLLINDEVSSKIITRLAKESQFKKVCEVDLIPKNPIPKIFPEKAPRKVPDKFCEIND